MKSILRAQQTAIILRMDELILDIASHISPSSATAHPITPEELAGVIRAHNAGISDVSQHFSKKKLYPYFLRMQKNDPLYWRNRGIGEETERILVQTLQMKPRRTASGVAPVTVITKPWKCGGDCVFCPNDIRMPKSYLHDEPACQRAERNFFDPYLQVASRLKALIEMGHPTDKVELIILGGTWCDYPLSYQIWYITRLFEALNDGQAAIDRAGAIRARYKKLGFENGRARLEALVADAQARIDAGLATYNDMWDAVYGTTPQRDIAAEPAQARHTTKGDQQATAAGAISSQMSPWLALHPIQQGDFCDLETAQKANETANHRVVGLVIETRPDRVTPDRCALLRRFGCTKVQVGVQSLQADVLGKCGRELDEDALARAFALLRLFGFKIHAHFMANLPGSTPSADKEDYRRFVEDPRWKPDELKLYPTVMVKGTRLCDMHAHGEWAPYPEDELVDVLADDMFATPTYMRISRMIRDISASDIVAGNKKTNLRQMVEQRVRAEASATGRQIREIRYREISTSKADTATLMLDESIYETATTQEVFLQWITPDGHIAGFLRLSLPHAHALSAMSESRSRCDDASLKLAALPSSPSQEDACSDNLTARTGNIANVEQGLHECRPLDFDPLSGYPQEGEAMIREVHIYGYAAQLHKTSTGAQHRGLGKRLIERACDIARSNDYVAINVISAVGTREYYRKLGFTDEALYLRRTL